MSSTCAGHAPWGERSSAARFIRRSQGQAGQLRTDLCLPCKYMTTNASGADAMVVATTGGWGRTGNVYWSLRNATHRAHACKLRLTLPATDAIGHAFQPEESTRLFDFSTRRGVAHPDCGNASLAAGMRGDMRKFWFLPPLPNTTARHAAFFASYDPELPHLDQCIMWYIGRCHPGYCNGLEHLKDKLVAHIRQGDVFPANFNSTHVHPLYGQPPLSYYLAAFNHRPWSEVIVVSAPTTDVNPVWAQLEVLNSSGIAKLPIQFQASASWGQDFRTMMCAPNFVESHSTLHDVSTATPLRCRRSFLVGVHKCTAAARTTSPLLVGIGHSRFAEGPDCPGCRCCNWAWLEPITPGAALPASAPPWTCTK